MNFIISSQKRQIVGKIMKAIREKAGIPLPTMAEKIGIHIIRYTLIEEGIFSPKSLEQSKFASMLGKTKKIIFGIFWERKL